MAGRTDELIVAPETGLDRRRHRIEAEEAIAQSPEELRAAIEIRARHLASTLGRLRGEVDRTRVKLVRTERSVLALVAGGFVGLLFGFVVDAFRRRARDRRWRRLEREWASRPWETYARLEQRGTSGREDMRHPRLEELMPEAD